MPKTKAKSKQKATQTQKPKSVKAAQEKKADTKLQIVIDLLKRPEGATVDDIMKATEWQKHTVRGCMSGALKKKQGYEIVSEKPTDGDRVYKIVTNTT